VTFSVFESSCHLLLPATTHRDNLVKCLAQGHNKRSCWPIFTLPLFNAERQAGKLLIPNYKVFWSDSARKSLTLLKKTLRCYTRENMKKDRVIKNMFPNTPAEASEKFGVNQHKFIARKGKKKASNSNIQHIYTLHNGFHLRNRSFQCRIQKNRIRPNFLDTPYPLLKVGNFCSTFHHHNLHLVKIDKFQDCNKY